MSESATAICRASRSRTTLLLCLCLVSAPAFAHKLQVFAFADGSRIQGSAYFAGGAKASGARIHIQNASGKILAELSPDREGQFSYEARTKENLVVIAESADGHRAEWHIRAEELAGEFSTPEPATSERHDAAGSETWTQAPSSPPPTPESDTRSANAELLMRIEQAVARQVRPLREELIAAQDRAHWHEVLGGIGYIIGLTGLALWMKSRSRDKDA